MQKHKRILAGILSLALAASCLMGTIPVQANDASPSTFQTEFAGASNHDAKLRVRYWLPGGWAATNLDEIRREIKELADAGYGTIEVADVRDKMSQTELDALAKPDENGDSYLYGSKNWEKSIKTVLEAAKEYGITVDLTFGQRWPASSNEITPNDEAAAKELVYGTVELGKGESHSGAVTVNSYVTTSEEENPIIENKLIGVYAAQYTGTETVKIAGGFMQPAKEYTQYTLDESTMQMLTPDENGAVAFTAPEDNYVLLAVYQRGTGQLVGYQPAMDNHTGTEYDSYVIDHFGHAGVDVVQAYYENNLFADPETEQLMKAVGGTFFEDSLEMTSVCLWTDDMLDEFEECAGYSLKENLPYVLYLNAMNTTSPFVLENDSDNKVERVRNDYIETLSNLYNKEHVQNMVDWADTFGMGYRVQAYGSTIDSALASATATNPEGESLTFGNKHDSFRVMAAGRDMGGNTLLSDEIGANFGYGSSYGFPFDDLLANFNKNYASGVNSMYLHGYSYAYSPEAEWPGFHAFGSSIPGPFSSRMPEWTHINDITDYINRTQYVLQQGVQKTDVAIYQPTYNASFDAPYYTDTGLTEAGYSYQFFTRSLFKLDSATVQNGVLNPDGPGYRAMILNDEPAMAVETIDKLIEYANAGLPIIVVGQTPTTSIAYGDSDAEVVAKFDQLLAIDGVVRVEDTTGVVSALSKAGVTPDAAKQTANANVITLHRSTGDADFYYLYNEGTDTANLAVTLTGEGSPFLLDPWTGDITPIVNYTVQNGKVTIPVEIASTDNMLIGLSASGIFGEAATDYATSASTDVRYEDGKLTARVFENGSYEVTDNSNQTFAGEVTDIPETTVLDGWDLTVETWSKGDNADNDVLDTKKTDVVIGETPLVAWKEIEQLGETAAGVGRYATTFPFDTANSTGAVLDIEEAFDTFRVFVNGQQLPAANLITKQIDLGGYLVSGENTLVIEVASTLANAVGMRSPQSYGLIGDVSVIPYRDVVLEAPGADKSILDKVIAYAQAQKEDTSFEQVIESVQNSFNAALEQAQQVSRNAAASQTDVDSAWQTLMTEIHKLGFIRGDKTSLGKLIETADGFAENISRYTPSTAEPFTAVLEQAKLVYNDGDAMQQDVEEAEASLLDAMMNLRFKADKSILEEVLAEASQVDTAQYTAETVAIFSEALDAANAVSADAEATQQAVNEAADNLKAAINGLKKVGTAPVATNVQGDSTLTTGSGNAKTGETAPIALAVSALVLAGAGFVLSKKKK